MKGKLTNTVAALDLGGGSIQITFIPTNSKQIIKDLPEFITEYSIMNENVKLYSHRYMKNRNALVIFLKTNKIKYFSYLGLGLMAARKSIFTMDNDSLNVTSPCVQEAAIRSPYKFAQNTYYVS